MKQIPFIIVIAAVEIAAAGDVTSNFIGAALAMLGGGLWQMRRTERGELTACQIVAEWGLSGFAGFLAHTLAMRSTTDPWLIWTSCVAAGMAGSSGLSKFVEVSNRNDDN